MRQTKHSCTVLGIAEFLVSSGRNLGSLDKTSSLTTAFMIGLNQAPHALVQLSSSQAYGGYEDTAIRLVSIMTLGPSLVYASIFTILPIQLRRVFSRTTPLLILTAW